MSLCFDAMKRDWKVSRHHVLLADFMQPTVMRRASFCLVLGKQVTSLSRTLPTHCLSPHPQLLAMLLHVLYSAITHLPPAASSSSSFRAA